MSSDSDKPASAGSSNGSGQEPAAEAEAPAARKQEPASDVDKPQGRAKAAEPAPAKGARGNGKDGPAEGAGKGGDAPPRRVLSGSVSKKGGDAPRRTLTASIDRGGGKDPEAPEPAKKPPGTDGKDEKQEEAAGDEGSQAPLAEAAEPAASAPRKAREAQESKKRPLEKRAATAPGPVEKPAAAPGTAPGGAAKDKAAPVGPADKKDAAAEAGEPGEPPAKREERAIELRATAYPFDAEARRQRRVWPLLLFLLVVIAAGLGWLYWDLQGGEPAAAMPNEELRELEELLAKLDFAPGEVDGVVDEETRAAVRLFQEFAGLPIDGEPTPALLEELREVVGMM